MPQRPDPFAPVAARRREIPYEFVLDRLAPLAPTTRAMFGALGVYLDERVVCILRQKGDSDDGVWLAFEPDVMDEMLLLLPTLQRIDRLGNVRAWRKLAASSASFEDDVLQVCKLLLAGDTRVGKLPDRLKAKQRKPRTKSAGKPARAAKRATPTRAAKHPRDA